MSAEVADQVVAYLGAGLAALGALPTQDRLVIERVFDESEGTQLIVHSPYGGRINRALGLALRKRFCVSFDFELQAAADDDTVVLSLGPQHSFPLSQVPTMLQSGTVTDVLTQAVLPHPMLAARWRWNLNRALVVPRSRGGQRRPIHLQRMEAEDLLAASWPALAACQENAAPGPVPVPDHVLVRQTVTDCLTEPLDADGLVALLEDLEAGRVGVHLVESAEPSPLAHGILTGRPFTFLDGAPLEERRTRAVPVPRGLGPLGPDGLPAGLPVAASELGPLDPDAAAEVLDQVRPRPRDADELHDLLLSLVLCRPVPAWQSWFDALRAEGRAGLVGGGWAATERRDMAEGVHGSLTDPMAGDDEGLAECVRGHLEVAGPVTVEELVGAGPLPTGSVHGAPVTVARARTGLARLEAAGSAIDLPDGRWCARHLLVRLHAASRSRRRRHVEPASMADFVRFAACWQHVAAGTQAEGRAGLLAVIEQLQGLEVAAGEWERTVLPARVAGYDPRWLDELCLAGEVAWGRLTPRPERVGPRGDPARHAAAADRRRRRTRSAGARPRRHRPPPWPSSPDPTSPGCWLPCAPIGPWSNRPWAPRPTCWPCLRSQGARFRSELAAASGRLDAEVDEGLWDLVARGHRDRGRLLGRAVPAVGPPSPAGAPARLGPAVRPRPPAGRGRHRGRARAAGPCCPSPTPPAPDPTAARRPRSWPRRWPGSCWPAGGWWPGSCGPASPTGSPGGTWCGPSAGWRPGARPSGGRFVAGISGEQYASPEAVALLADVRRDPGRGAEVEVAGADPLNLTGTVLGGARVPAVRDRSVRYRGGVPAEPVAIPAR